MNNVFVTSLSLKETKSLKSLGVQADVDGIPGVYHKKIADALEQNVNFQLLLKGKSTTLDLSRRRQAYINVALLQRFPNLSEIHMRDNVLDTIPDEIGTLNQLQILDLSYNRICSLPKALSGLNQLRQLELSNNVLTQAGIPASLWGLPSLKLLDLRNNKLQSFPAESVSNLPKLKKLKLSGNEWEHLDQMLSEIIIIDTDGSQTAKYLQKQ